MWAQIGVNAFLFASAVFCWVLPIEWPVIAPVILGASFVFSVPTSGLSAFVALNLALGELNGAPGEFRIMLNLPFWQSLDKCKPCATLYSV